MIVQARVKVFYLLCNKWQTKTQPVPTPAPTPLFYRLYLTCFLLRYSGMCLHRWFRTRSFTGVIIFFTEIYQIFIPLNDL